ncbi:ca94745b-74a2-466d-bc4a-aa2a58e6fe5c [Sclerotinia trifoliorum]|uniref:Ca94745b-74a2-466d-bc4a-aa2a58e6fe5c n=1 Tax=Sclerotinia trifoliorum TaxID=28548 RepID=A0A8H2VP01_9HELO|nr:ca94745b-74a2-466d-bc4a-aa2a58e6fe5c [Sclerotinia trifoliorum]
MKSTIAFSALLAVATANPFLKARTLDISAYKAVPTAPARGAPAGNTVTASITYNPKSVSDAAVAAATVSVAVINRRHKRSTCPSTCAALPAGNGPRVNSPDTVAAFEADLNLSDAALNAVTPPGYVRVDGFQNVHAAAESATYLTYISDSFTSYDPAICANACNDIQGCTSFNIFFERDPTVAPDADDCPNPPSQTLIKCSLFGGLLDPSLARNNGQFQADFQVVIAGSNAYNAVAPPAIPGYGGVQDFGTATIDAPANTTTYMGVQAFPQTQPYDPTVCAAACTAKSNPGCAFFVSYILYENGRNGVFTCTYFTVSYGSDRAIETGQYDEQGNHYTIGHSFGFTADGYTAY